jgi:predicted DNA-binding transcriptional regulator YafY
VLRFSAQQGKYIKSLPLHPSQKIISDNAEGLIIKLQIYVTFDFEMELLSHGANLGVLEPAFLRESVKSKLKDALSSYG